MEANNESLDLKGQIEDYKSKYGFYPSKVSADQIYGTHENRQYMKSLDIDFTGVELGRHKQLTDEFEGSFKRKEKETQGASKS